MRKLRRIVLNALTVLSALLLVTAIFGWKRSMTRHDLVNWQPTDNSLAYVLLPASGELTLGQGFFWGLENRARFYYSHARVAARPFSLGDPIHVGELPVDGHPRSCEPKHDHRRYSVLVDLLCLDCSSRRPRFGTDNSPIQIA
ncbi:MAG: hypothetical protein H7Z14_00485 [Anaerolineae bacterium]|nr:hypothetical protein [Phycisphaerae bacterium]